VEALEAADQTDPRVWARASIEPVPLPRLNSPRSSPTERLPREIEQVKDNYGYGDGAEADYAYRADLDALIERCAALDQSPSFATEMTRLAKLEAVFRDGDKEAYRHQFHDFAETMAGLHFAELSKVPTDDRALATTEFLKTRSRALVFLR
jgi:hypothetical protein